MIAVRKILSKLSVVLALGLVAAPAHADVNGIATTVLNELKALVGPAILLGIVWLGILIMTGRGTLITLLTFFVGVAIIVTGGFF